LLFSNQAHYGRFGNPSLLAADFHKSFRIVARYHVAIISFVMMPVLNDYGPPTELASVWVFELNDIAMVKEIPAANLLPTLRLLS